MVLKVAVFLLALVVAALLWARSLKDDEAAKAPTPPEDSVLAPIGEGLKTGIHQSGQLAEEKLKDSAVEKGEALKDQAAQHGETLKEKALETGAVVADKAGKVADKAAEVASDTALEAADQWRYMLKEAAQALPQKK